MDKTQTYKSNVSVDNEVQNLFRMGGKHIKQGLMALRGKYGDSKLYDQIEKATLDRYAEVTKKAKKFAHLIREKYANSNYPYHLLLEKAYKYKVKYNLKDSEFTEFQKIYESELAGINLPDLPTPLTNVSKLLGEVSLQSQPFGKLNENDTKVLHEILKLHALTKPLHAQVVLQSIQYEDCAIEALIGKYDPKFHNVNNHVHPVIAALFLPKIDILETQFLHSNFFNIIKTRYQNEPFSSLGDVTLFDALSKDPNDVVCDSRSTMVDLFNRANLQNQLWNNVLGLRTGQYYNNTFRDFINSIDMCRLNKYDSPDLVYGRYDGTILKRLLSAFSFRPTVVTVSPLLQTLPTNPYQQNIKPTVAYISMINLKLSPLTTNQATPLSLNDSLNQTQVFIEGDSIVYKNTSLIYSRILFFYVDRRSHVINIKDAMSPWNFTKLPSALGGFERLNDSPIDFDFVLRNRKDIYHLRSVILSEIISKEDNNNLIIGSSAIIVKQSDPENRLDEDQYLFYHPVQVLDRYVSDATNTIADAIDPITSIQKLPSLNDDGRNATEFARHRGIVFMYELQDDESKKPQILY